MKQLKNTYKKLNYKIRSPLIDIGKSSHTIILAGMGRSGTTWAGNIINHDNSKRILFEPFFPGKVSQAKGFEYIQYLSQKSLNKELALQAKKILAGKVRSEWVDRENPFMFYRYRIVKDIRINLMLGWLKNIAGKPSIVLILRHPLQVVDSWQRLGWGKAAYENKTDIEIILSQKDLLTDYPIIKNVLKKIDLNDFVTRTVFQWCLFYYVPAYELKKSENFVLFYENLITKPKEQISALFQYLKKEDEMNQPTLQKSLNKLTSTNYLGRSKKTERFEMVNSWKTTFTKKQIQTANSILSEFGLNNLYDHSGLPTGESLFNI